MTAPFQESFADTSEPTVYPATMDERARSPWRLTLIAIALTLILGAVGGGWLALYLTDPGSKDEMTSASDGAGAGPTPPADRAVAVRGGSPTADGQAAANAGLAGVPAISPSDAATISARVSLLEERLTRIALTAESASGNAAKAEAILVAFAARRALDRGLPLGPMEAQLRVRFGETQPKAVESILSASARPITLEELLQRLDALRPLALTDSSAGWLTRLGSGLSNLIVIRADSTPSPAPIRRFERAQRAVTGDRVDEAITEVGALPGAGDTLVKQWLTDARRYNDARRALDLIETAAIIEPGQNRNLDIPVVLPAR